MASALTYLANSPAGLVLVLLVAAVVLFVVDAVCAAMYRNAVAAFLALGLALLALAFLV